MKNIVLIIFVLSVHFVPGQTFVREYSIQSNSFGKAIAKSYDGNIILGGTTISNIGDTDMVILKTNLLGDTLWTKFYSGIDDEDLVGMITTQDSGLALLAVSESTNTTRLLKTDSIGNIQWTKTYHGIKSFSFIQTLDNGFCFCGTRFYSPGPVATNSIIFKTDLNGDTMWTLSRGYSMLEYSARQIIQNPDSSFVMAELIEQLDIGVPGLVKISPGGQFISKTSSQPALEEYYELAFCKTSDSSYFLSGDGWDTFNGYEYIKFNSALTCNWSQCISPPGYPIGTYSMIQTRDGNIVLVQTTQVLKIDTAGNQIWNQRFNGLSSKSKNAVVELNDGSLALCASMTNHICLVRIDSSGYNCLANLYPLTIVSGIGFCQDDTLAIEMQDIYSVTSSVYPIISTQVIEQTNCFQNTDIRDREIERTLSISPNPNTGKFLVNGLAFNEKIEIELFNLLGEKVPAAVDFRLLSIDCSFLPPGIYILQATDGEKIYRGKIIKD